MNYFLHQTKLSISEADYRQVNSEWSSSTFAYPHNRLYYVSQGQAKIILKDRCIYLREGYLYLLPAFMMVESICDQSFTHYYVHFHIDSLEFTTYLSYYLPKFYCACNEPEQIITLFKGLTQNYFKTDIASDLANQGTIGFLLAPFFEKLNTNNPQIQRFTPVLNYIDAHLSSEITIEELARIITIEKVYFSNLFSRTFGISPRKYINQCRLNRAQILLIQTDKRVKEIALEVGFENESYFSRLFRHKIGMTPGTYRKSF